jgi:RNA polymerase sigma-70 factor, ECF subfamily
MISERHEGPPRVPGGQRAVVDEQRIGERTERDPESGGAAGADPLEGVASEPSAPAAAAADFESLLASVIDVAYGTALRLTRNRADAEDLLQDASLSAFRGFAGFEPGSHFKAWFFRIMMNCYYAGYRRRQRQPSTVDFDDTPDLYLYKRSRETGISQTTADPAASLIDRLDTERVSDAIEQLPEEYRVVSTLYFMEDLTYQQIAEALGCPVGTVRSRLHRGRKMLQKALWALAEERGIVAELAGGEGEP